MASPADKAKHSKRIRRKTKEKIASPIAKVLRTRKYKMRVIQDKRGNKHDLDKMTHLDLVQAIEDLQD